MALAVCRRRIQQFRKKGRVGTYLRTLNAKHPEHVESRGAFEFTLASEAFKCIDGRSNVAEALDESPETEF
jgi:hypothetical protein